MNRGPRRGGPTILARSVPFCSPLDSTALSHLRAEECRQRKEGDAHIPSLLSTVRVLAGTLVLGRASLEMDSSAPSPPPLPAVAVARFLADVDSLHSVLRGLDIHEITQLAATSHAWRSALTHMPPHLLQAHKHSISIAADDLEADSSFALAPYIVHLRLLSIDPSASAFTPFLLSFPRLASVHLDLHVDSLSNTRAFSSHLFDLAFHLSASLTALSCTCSGPLEVILAQGILEGGLLNPGTLGLLPRLQRLEIQLRAREVEQQATRYKQLLRGVSLAALSAVTLPELRAFVFRPYSPAMQGKRGMDWFPSSLQLR